MYFSASVFQLQRGGRCQSVRWKRDQKERPRDVFLAWWGHRGQTAALGCPPFSRRQLWCCWVALTWIS